VSATALVRKSRDAATQPTGNECGACPSVGLAILPVRIATVPSTIKGLALPSHIKPHLNLSEDAKGIALGANRYALRTLRAGFLYLYYPHPAGGAWTWHCYMISPSGSLREIPISSPATTTPTEPVCAAKCHSVNSALIGLLNPEKIQKAYIAYSEHFWTDATRNGNAKALGSRMQEFSPAQWWAGQKGSHGISPSQLASTVLEYDNCDHAESLKSDYFTYSPRGADFAERLRARMERISPGRGMVLAIPDPLGCALSLNSQRLHALDELKRYISDPDRAWQHASAIQIQGLRDYVEQQAKETVKGPTRAGRSGTIVRTREQRIQDETKKGWARFEEHYSESARSGFLGEYAKQSGALQATISAHDKDYVAWLRSGSYALVRADYDTTNIVVGCQASGLDDCALAGGVLSDYSLQAWKEMLTRKADDVRNYAVLGILANQQKWASAFQSVDEKSIGDYILDWGTVGKEYDFARNLSESDKLGDYTKSGMKALNTFAGSLLLTVSGSIGAIAADAARKGLSANDQMLQTLERLQIKLGMAYARLHIEQDVVLLKVELTVDEWHRIATGYMRGSMGRLSKQTSSAFASMAMAVRLRVPTDSAAAKRLVPFLYWMAGTSAQLSGALKDISDGVGAVGASIARGATRGAGAITHAVTAAAENASDTGLRAVSIVGSTLKKGSAVLAGVPSRLSAVKAVQMAAKLTRNSMTIAASADVRLASIAAPFQTYGLYVALRDFDRNIGWKHTELGWAIGSSAMGLTGATLDLVGKATMAIKGEAAVVRIFGVQAAAATVVRTGGILGATASAADAVQSLMKAYTLGKRGDGDAMWWAVAGGVASAFAGLAGVGIALGYTALLGPVGLLIACIGAGLFFAYMAFMAEDTPVGIWLDRSVFGRHKRGEGAFKTQKQEADGLELVGKQFVIQLEWHDTMSIYSDEIQISLKRPAQTGDAVALGLVFRGGPSQEDRMSFVYLHGASFVQPAGDYLPQAFSQHKLAQSMRGSNFEAATLETESVNQAVDENGGSVHQWEKRIEVSTERFSKATVYLRYFPNRTDLSSYLDQELEIAD